jgi:hypothetical protein
MNTYQEAEDEEVSNEFRRRRQRIVTNWLQCIFQYHGRQLESCLKP